MLRTLAFNTLPRASPLPLRYFFSTVLLASSRTATDRPAMDNAAAGQQVKALSVLRREFKAIRAIWSRQCDLLNIYDEINTAKSTLLGESVVSFQLGKAPLASKVRKQTHDVRTYADSSALS